MGMYRYIVYSYCGKAETTLITSIVITHVHIHSYVATKHYLHMFAISAQKLAKFCKYIYNN